jgi:dolichol-phosphate mannosyltransferase
VTTNSVKPRRILIKKVLVVVPTYNEAENIGVLLSELTEAHPVLEILVVDDHSPDGTGKLVEKIARNQPRVHLLLRTAKTGLGDAYLAGFNWALQRNFQVIIEMDADGSHQVTDLPKLLQASDTHDLVIGSRWVNGGAVTNWPWYRRAISRFGNSYARMMLGTQIRDMTAGFRAFNAEFLAQLDTDGVAAHGYAFQVELAYRAHREQAKIIEVPITFIERTQGKSKMSSAIVVEALWLVTRWGLSRLLNRRPQPKKN